MTPPGADRLSVGVDVGATLAKLAIRDPFGELDLDYLPADALDELAERITAVSPIRVGVTGCGGAALAERLSLPTARVVEFEAWGHGSKELLRRQDVEPDAPYLLVSVGTGTSVLEIRGDSTRRVGGTALGGGTVVGLGLALTGSGSFEELCRLAGAGRRAEVDLLVGDIYRPGEIALPGEITAASFGGLARRLGAEGEGAASQHEDLVASLMGLVGENVALICCGLAAQVGVERIVYGGATLHDNPSLVAVLMGATAALGRQPLLLADGGFAGAVGALVLAVREGRVEG